MEVKKPSKPTKKKKKAAPSSVPPPSPPPAELDLFEFSDNARRAFLKDNFVSDKIKSKEQEKEMKSRCYFNLQGLLKAAKEEKDSKTSSGPPSAKSQT